MRTNDIKELSIQIHLNGLSFCILNRTQNEIEFLKSYYFKQDLTPIEVLEELKLELSSNTAFSEDFNEVTVIHQNELSTLVPEALYNAEHKADYLKFNSKILRNDFITEDAIPINKSINVYVPYVNINNYIFDTFGAFVYKHSSSILITAYLELIEHTEDTKVFINVNKDSLEVIVVADKKLQLFNVFEFHSKEDFIYYVLFVFEQLQLDVETVPIELAGKITLGDELYIILYRYIRHVDFIEKEYNFAFNSSIDNRYLYQDFLILNSF
ncbi:uncharacterized protein DUF3822 [Winogradskyella epiphytica]|uniref:Uncharacterized protein DUF3822 n=1 Tax=Winogradskyella epiphytica TaxID=262005 RepID=A0A2V4XFL7_9FLAO|nr:DUF3822 family protein [Winogradskyella epiphytica]PYE81855.1 uncharacterized protein DUF3822 [Winogradskyella epiphytica]GGW62171.1 hypothetical protein GCM10008085_12380 [Winogradskyella epiphytica]